MKKLFTAFMFIMASCTLVLAQKDNRIPRSLNGEFSKIEVSTGIQLYLTAASEASVSVSVGDDKWADDLKTEIQNGTLKIYFHQKSKWRNVRNKKLKAYVNYKTLDALHCSSGAQAQLLNPLQARQFTLTLSSGSSVSGTINAGELKTTASSGAVADIDGSAQQFFTNASSGSRINAHNLAGQVCYAHVSSGALVKLHVKKQLNAEAHSGGAIKYTGNKIEITKELHSGGSVKEI